MSCWGTELWDQFDSILKYEDRSVGFCETIENFIKERSFIEEEYAKAIRRLVKSVQACVPLDAILRSGAINGTTGSGVFTTNGSNGKGSLPVRSSLISTGGSSTNGAAIYGSSNKTPTLCAGDYFNSMSFVQSFAKIVREHQDIASQHELISENLRSGVLNRIQELKRRSTEAYKERKRELEKFLEAMNKSLRKYEQAYQLSSKATDAYQRANEDINLSRAQVEKARLVMNKRNTECEQIRLEYSAQVERFNDAKNAFYREDLVRVFGELEEFNSNKINQLKECFKRFVDAHSQVVPRVQDCLTQMSEAVVMVNADVDSVCLMDNLKTGYSHPENQAPVDLRNERATRITSDSVGLFGRKGSGGSTSGMFTVISSNGSGGTFASKSNTIRRVKRIITSRKKLTSATNSSLEISPSDFDSLPPAQRLKRYQTVLMDLNREIETKKREREALSKMQSIYTENPRFGETEKVDEKLHQTDLTIVTLSTHAKKFETLISNVMKLNESPSLTEHKDEEQSSTRDDGAPDLSMIQEIDTSAREQVTIVGSAITQYAFDAVQHAAVTKGSHGKVNMLSFDAMEEMDLLEPDLGDGWIKVRRRTTCEIGFVPSSYCNIHMFDRIVVDFN